jgi:hypothetical protein
MYLIFKDGRPAGNRKFQTYEQARQEARKRVRRNSSFWVLLTEGNNPAINHFGYQVKKV